MRKIQRKIWAYFLLAVGAFVLDRITKQFILSRFALGESVEVIPKFLWFTHIHNTGVAFGLGTGLNVVFAAIALVALLVLLWKWREIVEENWLVILCGLILGGVLGNLYDRLAYGFVVDFIDLHWWPAFNVADSALTVGAIGLVIYFWKSEKKEKKP